jgi:hypothetical protein
MRLDLAGRASFLVMLLLAQTATSFLHFAHNAEFLSDYPNMPAWLSPPMIYVAWLAVTAIGLGGYLLVRRGYEIAGLAILAAYAALGFDSLAHYSLADFGDHNAMTHLTIWLEAASAALLLAFAASALAKRVKR